MGIEHRKVNWVLDADIRGFFDNIDHEWMLRFLEHRIADRRILRLIRKWLTAGVSEDGQWSRTTVGTPQGSVISPLLANVFLHYVLDLWANQWRERHARGSVIIVRYADDFVMGFQSQVDAERFLRELQARMEKFGLQLHPEKTRLIEFGRYAAERREKRGDGKPESFNFLGFTHCCGKTRKGTFTIKRKIDCQAAAGQTAGNQTAVEVPHAQQGERGGQLVTIGRSWVAQLPRGAGQHQLPRRILHPGRTSMAACTSKTQPERTYLVLVAVSAFGAAMDAQSPNPPSLSRPRTCREAPKVRAV